MPSLATSLLAPGSDSDSSYSASSDSDDSDSSAGAVSASSFATSDESNIGSSDNIYQRVDDATSRGFARCGDCGAPCRLSLGMLSLQWLWH